MMQKRGPEHVSLRSAPAPEDRLRATAHTSRLKSIWLFAVFTAAAGTARQRQHTLCRRLEDCTPY